MNTVLNQDRISWRVLFVLSILAVTGCTGSYQTESPVRNARTPNGPNNPELPPAAALDCDAIAADAGSVGLAFDALPGGIWDGTVTNITKNQSSYIQAWVAEHGSARFLYYPSDAAMSADLEIHGAEFTGVGLAYADSGDPWSDGSLVTEFAATGTIAERNSITGIWSAASGDSGCFAISRYYDYLYEETSAVEFLAGVWTGNPTLSVDQNGSFFGQDAQGCAWAGQFASIDPRFNMYDVIADVSNCGIAGNYRGLAYRDYVFVPERVLRLAIDNEHRAIRLSLDD